MSAQKAYLAIDLKSFYASVECHERGLDPLKTNLVVADPDRTEKTICLAVSPSLRSFGIPARARLFEVIQKVREVNRQRRLLAPGRTFTGKSANIDALGRNPPLRSIISSPYRAWRAIWNTAHASWIFISSMYPLTICISIRWTKCSLTRPHTLAPIA